MRNRIFTFVACLVVATVVFTGCGDTPVSANPDTAIETVEPKTEAITATPAISTVDGDKLEALLAATEGKVTVLNFWATWCPPCVAEMPEFEEFYQAMDKDAVAFISLSADDPAEYEKVVGKFRKEAELTFPIHVLDTREPDALYHALRTEVSGALPTTIIYNKQGKVVHVWERETTQKELEATVKTLL